MLAEKYLELEYFSVGDEICLYAGDVMMSPSLVVVFKDSCGSSWVVVDLEYIIRRKLCQIEL